MDKKREALITGVYKSCIILDREILAYINSHSLLSVFKKNYSGRLLAFTHAIDNLLDDDRHQVVTDATVAVYDRIQWILDELTEVPSTSRRKLDELSDDALKSLLGEYLFIKKSFDIEYLYWDRVVIYKDRPYTTRR